MQIRHRLCEYFFEKKFLITTGVNEWDVLAGEIPDRS